jgi:hypothetical protein
MSLSLRGDEEAENKIDSIRKIAQLEAAAIFVGFAVLAGIVDWVRGDSLKTYGQEIAGFFLLLFFVWVAYSYYSEFSIRTKGINSRLASVEVSLAEFRTSLEARLAAIEKRIPREPTDSNSPIKPSGLSEGLKRLDQIEKEMPDRP